MFTPIVRLSKDGKVFVTLEEEHLQKLLEDAARAGAEACLTSKNQNETDSQE